MATSQATAVASSSLDVSNLSTVTSLPGVDPRSGAIYNAASVAAAQPTWFHPLKDGRHLMLCQRTWSGATPVGGVSAGVYSAFSENLQPSWFFVNGPAGQLTFVPGGQFIPLKTPVTDATLVAGASRSTDMLWPLHSVHIDGSRQAVLQFFQISSSMSVTNSGEEIIPSTDTVVFDKGIQYNTPYLYIYGTDSAGNLYRARKGWARVGFNPKTKTNTRGFPLAQGTNWEFYTGTGWSQDITELAIVQSGLTSDGPVSFGYWQDYTLMSTVTKSGTAYSANVWASNKGLPWSQQTLATPISLGDSGAGTYLGAGLQFMSQIGANPVSLPVGTNAGIVYLTSSKLISSGHYSLANAWGIYPINLVS